MTNSEEWEYAEKKLAGDSLPVICDYTIAMKAQERNSFA